VPRNPLQRTIKRRCAPVVDHGLESGCGAALTTVDVAIGLDSVGKSAASVEPYRAAAATLETLVTNDSGNSQWQNELAVVYGGLGEIFIRQGLGDEALDVTRKCLALLQKLVTAIPTMANCRPHSLSPMRESAMCWIGRANFPTPLTPTEGTLRLSSVLLTTNLAMP
jgi:hypothetical protein